MAKAKAPAVASPAPAAPDMAALIAQLAAAGMQLTPIAAATPPAAPTAPAAPVAVVTPPAAVVPQLPATRFEMLLAHFNDTQAKALDALAAAVNKQLTANKAAAEDADARSATLTVAAAKAVETAWPAGSPCPVEAWDAFKSDAYAYGMDGKLLPALTKGEKRAPNVSATYLGKVLNAAYAKLHGSIPNKGQGVAGAASKGDHPKRVLRGINARLVDLAHDADRLSKCKKAVEPAALAAFLAAVAAVVVARDKLATAIAATA